MTNIKILVSYKEEHTVINSDIIIPIQTGRAGATRIKGMIGDDTGDNISAKNADYAELTAQYWVWKNYDQIGNPDYVGFMHYRRVLNFTRKDISFFNELDFSTAADFCRDYDIVTGEKLPATLLKMKKTASNIREQWKTLFDIKDLDFAIDLIKKEYPEMSEIADRYLASPTAYWYNIFVMKKQLFTEYCDWLFGILAKCENHVSGDRMIGMIAERIMNIFIEYKRVQGAKIAELPFFRPNKLQYAKDNLIPIVLISSDEYIHKASATILSAIENCRHPESLRFVILADGISAKNKAKCQKIFKNYTIDFLDIKASWLTEFAGITLPAHVPITTFARLLVPDILSGYDKIIYLDSDILIRKDIIDLYNTDMSGYALGLCQDVANSFHSERLSTDDYYNCGIMLFNAKEYQKIYHSSEAKAIINRNKDKYRICDQDIVNDVFRNKIFCLDPTWNLHHLDHPSFRFYKPRSKEEYEKAANDPAVVHFVGPDKPWYPSSRSPYRKEYLSFYDKMTFDRSIIKKLKYKDRTKEHKYVLFFNLPFYHQIKQNDVVKKYCFGIRIIKKKNDGITEKTKIFFVPVKKKQIIGNTKKVSYLGGLFSYKKTDKYKKIYFLGIPFFYKKNADFLETLLNSQAEALARNEYLSKKIRKDLELINSKLSNLKVIIEAQELHKETFEKYKNAFAGKDVVLVCTGPSAKAYTKMLPDTIHVGVNGAVYLEQINLDYLFVQDYTIHQKNNSSLVKDCFDYRNDTCKKFFGIIPDDRIKIIKKRIERIPLSYTYRDNINQYVLEDIMYNEVAYDLSYNPMGQFGSTTFSALQFILYAHPKKIFIVGWDCASGYAYRENANNQADYQISILKKHFLPFITVNYPDIEILSVNPVGLKGIFHDVYTKEYLTEHPEIQNAEILKG